MHTLTTIFFFFYLTGHHILINTNNYLCNRDTILELLLRQKRYLLFLPCVFACVLLFMCVQLFCLSLCSVSLSLFLWVISVIEEWWHWWGHSPSWVVSLAPALSGTRQTYCLHHYSDQNQHCFLKQPTIQPGTLSINRWVLNAVDYAFSCLSLTKSPLEPAIWNGKTFCSILKLSVWSIFGFSIQSVCCRTNCKRAMPF